MIVREKKHSGRFALYRVKYPLYRVYYVLCTMESIRYSFLQGITNLLSVEYLNMYGELHND